MTPRWNCIIHYADVDYTTAVYSEAAVSSLTGLTNYGTLTIPVYEVNESPEIESPIEQASGRMRPTKVVRDTYQLKFYPKKFATDRDKFTDNITTLAKKSYLWIQLSTVAQDGTNNVGITTNYHATAYTIPVVIDGYELSTEALGYKMATLTLRRGFRS